MEQGLSWEAKLFSASQEIPRVLWKPKVYYRSPKCPRKAASYIRIPTSLTVEGHLYALTRRRECCDAAQPRRPNARDFIEMIHLREDGPNFPLPPCYIALHAFSQFIAKPLPRTLANCVSVAPTRMAYSFRWRNRWWWGCLSTRILAAFQVIMSPGWGLQWTQDVLCDACRFVCLLLAFER